VLWGHKFLSKHSKIKVLSPIEASPTSDKRGKICKNKIIELELEGWNNAARAYGSAESPENH